MCEGNESDERDKKTRGETVECVSDLCFRLVKSLFVATSILKHARVSIREASGLWTRRWRPGGVKQQNPPRLTLIYPPVSSETSGCCHDR